MRNIDKDLNLPELEQTILARWESEETFKRSIEMRKEAKEYVFYDGPPFANNLPHYGHLLAGIIKDIVPGTGQCEGCGWSVGLAGTPTGSPLRWR